MTTRLTFAVALLLAGCSAATSSKKADPEAKPFTTAATTFLEECKDFWTYVAATPYGEDTEPKQARVEKAFKAIPQSPRDLIPMHKDCELLDTSSRLAALTISMSKRNYLAKGDEAEKYSEEAWKKENAANVQEHFQKIETLRMALKSNRSVLRADTPTAIRLLARVGPIARGAGNSWW